MSGARFCWECGKPLRINSMNGDLIFKEIKVGEQMVRLHIVCHDNFCSDDDGRKNYSVRAEVKRMFG